MKQAVIVLLPVFWLVTLGYAPFESAARAATFHYAAASTPDGDASPAAPESCDLSYVPNNQIRHALRRQFLDRNEEKEFFTGLLPGAATAAPAAAIAASPLMGGAFSLQQYWQFVWRTANSPRAPTFLV